MLRRSLVLLLALSCLAVPLAGATIPSTRHAAARERGAPVVFQNLGVIWEALTSFLFHLKAHGSMDPDGAPVPPPPGNEADAHGSMDPNG